MMAPIIRSTPQTTYGICSMQIEFDRSSETAHFSNSWYVGNAEVSENWTSRSEAAVLVEPQHETPPESPPPKACQAPKTVEIPTTDSITNSYRPQKTCPLVSRRLINLNLDRR